MRRLLLFFIIALYGFDQLSAADILFSGTIIDKDSKNPIVAASVTALEQKKRSFSNRKGEFKLPIKSGVNTIVISSIGYCSDTIRIDKSFKQDSLTIELKANPIKAGEAIVIGDIQPEEIIKRAIAKKSENQSKIRTVEALVYSKLFLDVMGSSAKFSGDGSTTKAEVNIFGGPDNKEKTPTVLFLESFTRNYQDIPNNLNYNQIEKRRQTKNINSDANMLALTEYVNFYDDEIKLLDARFPAPLCSFANSFYNYEILTKKRLDDKIIYEMTIKPKSDASPGFIGKISIIDGSYELIEADLRPHPEDAILFVKDLHYYQKYSEVEKGLWYPLMLDIDFSANINAVKGFLEFNPIGRVRSVVNEIKINKPLPDSLYKYSNRSISVADPEADSSKDSYWDFNSLYSLSDEEKAIFKNVDSAVAKIKQDSIKKGPIQFGIDPLLDFNRVESVDLGLSPSMNFYTIPVKSDVYYSFGQKKIYADFDISYKASIDPLSSFEFSFGMFDKADIISQNLIYPKIANALVLAFLHSDYYDYMETRGLAAKLKYKYLGLFEANIGYENSRHNSIDRTTSKTLYDDEKLRDNPHILNGRYSQYNFGVKLGDYSGSVFDKDFKWKIIADGFYGEKDDLALVYKGVQAQAGIEIPLFRTGYKPISLELFGRGGISTDSLPEQFQFRMPTSLRIYADDFTFISAKEAKFGGNRYWEAHAKFNITDYLWRALDLPLFNGRGLELSLAFSGARYYNTNIRNLYQDTKNNYYAEVGFDISRIPSYISDFFYFTAKARWGVGPEASGRAGFALSAHLPF
jgi:hypothetical protein